MGPRDRPHDPDLVALPAGRTRRGATGALDGRARCGKWARTRTDTRWGWRTCRRSTPTGCRRGTHSSRMLTPATPKRLAAWSTWRSFV
jgi:hypothetical protein